MESKRSGKPKYKRAVKPSNIADNELNREFTIEKPNQYWCGDITSIWSGKQFVGELGKIIMILVVGNGGYKD